MLLAWLLATAALAQTPAAEEIVVYDARAVWDDTRWLVQSEYAVATAMRLGVPGERPFRSPAWQLEVVLACTLDGQRRASCLVEDLALRAATIDLWRRPADRERVSRTLRGMRDRLLGRTLEVRFDGRGGLTRIDVREASSDEHLVPVVDVATRALGGVHLPRGALADGARWTRSADRLLRLPPTVDGTRTVTAHHVGAHHDGHYVVQSRGQAAIALSSGSVLALDDAPDEAAIDLTDFATEGDDTRRGVVRMASITSIDPATALVEERVFSVLSPGPVVMWQTGAVRRLAPDEHPALGATEIVAYPTSIQQHVAPWTSLQRLPLPTADDDAG